MTDLLIGGADLYRWSDIRIWASSIRQTGYDGEIALICYRVDNDVYTNAPSLGVDLYQVEHDPYGRPINHNAGGRNTQAHQMRFFHMWQFLSTDDNWKNYDKIISTDVRDVYFQNNPFNNDLMNDAMSPSFSSPLIASSEGQKYKNEPWGADNMLNGFGPLVWDIAKEWTIFNVGVTAGRSYEMMGLFLAIFSMTQNRYIPSDQSAYNILVNQSMWGSFLRTFHHDDWACQCGTVLDATKPHLLASISEPSPVVDGCVFRNCDEKEYSIVHQYDRLPGVTDKITAKLGL